MKKGVMAVSRQEVSRKLQAAKICPVTNGLPTTMTLEGFKVACDRCREQDKNCWEAMRAYKHTWCDTCQGNLQPKELRIISLDKLRRERQAGMYARSREMREHSPA